MEGYSVTEAASVLGVPTERVWELLARGVLSGAPDGETGMRVYLQPRPAPLPPAVDEPRVSGGRQARESEVEASPFRELLTEFRNLTERYGQALLALGESRGEVASLRSRVDLLEARFDLRLPMQAAAAAAAWGAQPSAPPAAEVPDTPRDAPRGAEPPADEHPTRRRRGRGHRATDDFAQALARADDPSPAELPGAAEAAAALAALRDELATAPAPDRADDAALPRELPAAEAFVGDVDPAPFPEFVLPPTPAPEPQPEREPIAAPESERAIAPAPAFEPEPVPASEPASRFDPLTFGPEPALEPGSPPAPEVELDAEPITEPETATLVAEPEPIAEPESSTFEPEPEPAVEAEPITEPEPSTFEPEPEPLFDREAPMFDAGTSITPTTVEAEPDLITELESAAFEPEPEAEPVVEPEPVADQPEPVAFVEQPDPELVDFADEAEPVVEPELVAVGAEGGPVVEPEPVAPGRELDVETAAAHEPEADISPAAPEGETAGTPDAFGEPAWDRDRYSASIEEPDWFPEERDAAERRTPVGVGQSGAESEVVQALPEPEGSWQGSGEPPAAEPTTMSVGGAPGGDPSPWPSADDPAAEMEVASTGSHVLRPASEPEDLPAQPSAPDVASVFPQSPWIPSAPASGSFTPAGPASRAYRRLRRIFPG